MSGNVAIGISACLLGNKVHVESGCQHDKFAVEQLSPYVEFVPVYPETQGSTAQNLVRQQWLCGYIVCDKSPDWGSEQIKVPDENDNEQRKSGGEPFAAELLRRMPWLPVEINDHLNDAALWENFIERIFTLHELNTLWHQGLTRAGLIAFHSRYKLSLLAHSQPGYRELGRFVADIEKWDELETFALEYRQRLMAILQHTATRRNHTNVLMHVQGYFRRYLSSAQRQELATLIDLYRQGMQPWQTPVMLIKHYLAEYPNSYLAQQRYFEPFPPALRSRSAVVHP